MEESIVDTFAGYRQSSISLTEAEAELISDSLQMEARGYAGVNVAATMGLTWVMDTLEGQWEGRGSWPRDLTLLDIQWEVVEETLNNQGQDMLIENQYPDGGWYKIS